MCRSGVHRCSLSATSGSVYTTRRACLLAPACVHTRASGRWIMSRSLPTERDRRDEYLFGIELGNSVGIVYEAEHNRVYSGRFGVLDVSSLSRPAITVRVT